MLRNSHFFVYIVSIVIYFVSYIYSPKQCSPSFIQYNRALKNKKKRVVNFYIKIQYTCSFVLYNVNDVEG